MGMKIVVPGANFSASGNPAVIQLIEGLPAADLAALYLFEDGTVDTAYSGLVEDVSGNGRHAPLITSSSARRTAQGFATAADNTTRNRGFGIDTGINVSDKFTVFGVSRNRLPADAAYTGQYVMPWAVSRNFTNAASPNLAQSTLEGNINGAGIGGVLHINQFNSGTSVDYAELASLSWQANPNGSLAWAGSVRPFVSNTGQPKSSWIAWALSFDKDVGYTFRTMGGGHSVASATHAGVFAAAHGANTSKHLFGAMGFQNSQINGEMALAGIYDGAAKSAAEMDVLIAAMKVRLADRIATIL